MVPAGSRVSVSVMLVFGICVPMDETTEWGSVLSQI